MNFYKKKKNLAHIRNFNKQCFTNWEFLNQNKSSKVNKMSVSSQILLSFLLVITLYLFISLGFSFVSDIFLYDSWEDVTALFTDQFFCKNNANLNTPYILPNDTPAKLSNTLSKIEIFYFIGVL